VGKGSTFSFTVPFDLVEHIQTSSSEKDQGIVQRETSSKVIFSNIAPPTLNVIVVDDSASNLKMLSMILKVHEVVHETAENGRIAVEMVKASPSKYQLILMDNLMPVMNGVEATKELRALGFPFLIIGVTCNVMEDDVAEYLDSGADEVLMKPVKVATIRMLLQYIADHGPLSKPGMSLQAGTLGFEWVHRRVV
jgi:CheY-like chemotaxis protein